MLPFFEKIHLPIQSPSIPCILHILLVSSDNNELNWNPPILKFRACTCTLKTRFEPTTIQFIIEYFHDSSIRGQLRTMKIKLL